MITGSRADVQAFNATLVEAYYEGDSIASIAQRSGRSTSTINKLIHADRVANGPRERKKTPRVDRRSLADKRSLSPHHGWIGLSVSRYRAEHNLTSTAFGMLIQTTRVTVRNMEIGAHDFTLTELARISEVLKVDYETLIIPRTPGAK